MKRCPQCGTTYTDVTLKFCLADGSLLEEPEADVVPPTRREGLQIDISEPQTVSRAKHDSADKGLSTGIKILIAAVVLVVLGGVVVVAAGIIFFVAGGLLTAGPPPPSAPTPEPTPQTEVKTIPVNEVDELEKRLKELVEQLEQKDDTVTPPKVPSLKDVLGDDTVATVDSPKDGFLALRSMPGTEIGERIDRIPHGTKILVVSCDDEQETVAGRRGRWCLVEWNAKVGWVFDAWLRY